MMHRLTGRIKNRVEKTRALLFHYAVNRISIISQDTSNAQVVDYVFMALDDPSHYIANKMEKAAVELEVELVALLQVVPDMKERASRISS
ncbi:hypothetical protein V5799_022114 [Amblyomma americanum]|uniref:Uncharacterized protein n=1 Tax=Amblyomma americanum TaxID=6943 RepID=A0AAQ4FMY8_AMBAM